MNVVMDDTSEVYVKGDRPSLPLGLSCIHACPFHLITPYRESPSQGRQYHAHSTPLSWLIASLVV